MKNEPIDDLAGPPRVERHRVADALPGERARQARRSGQAARPPRLFDPLAVAVEREAPRAVQLEDGLRRTRTARARVGPDHPNQRDEERQPEEAKACRHGSPEREEEDDDGADDDRAQHLRRRRAGHVHALRAPAGAAARRAAARS